MTKRIRGAWKDGHPEILTKANYKARGNRAESMRGVEVRKKYDRDEYPPAMTLEGGKNASVVHIAPFENRSLGSITGRALSDYPNGTKFMYKIVP